MPTHVKVLTILTFIVGILGLLGATVASVVFGVIGAGIGAHQDENSGIALAILGLGGVALVATLIVFSVLSLACGWGLMKRRRWGRILAIVVACVFLIYFPFGTIFGAYALWVLFNKETEAMFAARV
jgi:hypothetical protein